MNNKTIHRLQIAVHKQNSK